MTVTRLSRRAFVAGAPLALAACGAEEIWAPDSLMQERRYVHGGQPSLTLYTVRNVGSDNGAHSGLLVNASQRVMFDPAGTFKHPKIPERNDVLFGMSPRALEVYINYHTRVTYYTNAQTVAVSAGVAERVLQDVTSYGAVPKSMCTRSISTILGRTPGFESIRTVWFPDKLEESFAKIPGVKMERYVDDDSDNNAIVLQSEIA